MAPFRRLARAARAAALALLVALAAAAAASPAPFDCATLECSTAATGGCDFSGGSACNDGMAACVAVVDAGCVPKPA
jgi:hypothetical protein